ncbi:MAG TPA: hypothetical protein DEQ25_18045, partial [Methylophaga sp.]|nr:hypothetical protein [Methylophaga sp.]
EVEPLQQILTDYVELYTNKWQQMRADKLGLNEYKGDDDHELNQQLQKILLLAETDMTIFYRRL